ncbi:MAG: metal-dependent transcriptional regulator [Clostridia bacterium]|nr:metal-dependent transcriptional regulator [Clostridia bacterium]
MRIQESGENYLETILLLQQKKGNVRSVDIVNELNYSKSSVSRAVNILQKEGLISIDPITGTITFTEAGLKRAALIYQRHSYLKDFLMSLGVSADNAEQDACRIEHVICAETLDAIKKFLKKSKK